MNLRLEIIMSELAHWTKVVMELMSAQIKFVSELRKTPMYVKEPGGFL